jgi:hypothetical protein
VGELGVVQGDERLAECGRVAGLEGRVPLPVLVAETNHDHVGAAEQRLGPDRVHAGALVVLPEALLLRAQDVDADVVGGAMVGHRRQQLDWQARCANPLGDPLPPVRVDLAGEVDPPGRHAGHATHRHRIAAREARRGEA